MPPVPKRSGFHTGVHRFTVFLPLPGLLEAGRATTRKALWSDNLPAAVDGFFDLCQFPELRGQL